MKARALAIQILTEVEAGGWSDRLLQARAPKLIEARDRRLLQRLVLTTLRWELALDRRLDRHVHQGLERLEPPLRAALRLGLAQAAVLELPAAIAVSETVEALKQLRLERGTGLVNAVLRAALNDLQPLQDSESYPPWLLQRWQERWGAERAERLAAGFNRPGAAHFVALVPSDERARLRELLRQEGVETSDDSLHPAGFRVDSGAAQESTQFAAGKLVAIDEAAALIAELCCGSEAQAMVDLAAAPGGKTALLRWRHRGPLIAVDLDPVRARRLRDDLHNRLRLSVAVLRADATAPPLKRGAFDVVLLDAPCSGAGTLRRRPERRRRLDPQTIERCAQLQAGLLDAAADLVAPGGRLVYSVCSLEPPEGRDQLARFLRDHAEFALGDPSSSLPAAAAPLVGGDPPVFESRPELHLHEGFVAGVMIRKR